MERTIVIKLKENDALLLMQLCNMLTEKTVTEVFEKVAASYEENEMMAHFDKYYHGFDPIRMSTLAGYMMDKLEEVLIPEEDEVVVDCR